MKNRNLIIVAAIIIMGTSAVSYNLIKQNQYNSINSFPDEISTSYENETINSEIIEKDSSYRLTRAK